MVARCVALSIVLLMVWYFITSDAIRSDNAFLVPDALLTVLLFTSAVLPHRIAVPALIFSFAWAAAVYTTSLCSYAVRGQFAEGANHLALIIPSVVMAMLLARCVNWQTGTNENEQVRRSGLLHSRSPSGGDRNC